MKDDEQAQDILLRHDLWRARGYVLVMGYFPISRYQHKDHTGWFFDLNSMSPNFGNEPVTLTLFWGQEKKRVTTLDQLARMEETTPKA